ncbi:KUP/HAK/KT family potassium transporter [Amnibacterium sp.]|uniref:KUP/HAK/KT family potassium transporter n=1 Tax=Amnibacterium sp. TaxID=1872496 RepID=UPI003F7C6D03
MRRGRPNRAGVGAAVAAMGVVFGDIGTSPLYAASSTFATEGARAPGQAFVYGSTSTIVWALTLVVTVLYVRYLMRADNDGEGGLLALFGLLRRVGVRGRALGVFTVVAMLGAAMFLGDSVITPAISVLSAVEGVKGIDPGFGPLVLPIAVVVLIGVFVLQRVGSGAIGRVYGPIMLFWFALLAVTGVISLLQDPSVLQVLSPHWVVLFFVQQPAVAFLSLGSVVLAVTGAEALYADMGHFGRRPITRAWLLVVFPALILNYLGQASLVVRHPDRAGSPFYALVPGWAQVPAIVLATAATIIASQAVISGAFSVVHQAWRLGIFPPLRVVHTSETQGAQIFVPAINVVLALAVLGVTIGFRSSAALASAYGIAVTTTISITAIVYLGWTHHRHGRIPRRDLPVVGVLLVMLLFVAANLPKAPSGGWLPLTIGAVFFVVTSTWWVGQRRIRAARRTDEAPLTDLLDLLRRPEVVRVPGAAVFTARNEKVVPIALRTMVQQTRALQERALIFTWNTATVPFTTGSADRVRIVPLGGGIMQVVAQIGFRERLRMAEILEDAREAAAGALDDFDPAAATFYVSTPIPRYNPRGSMYRWAQGVFLAVERLAPDPLDLIELPRDRTIVVGREVPL